MIGNKPGGAEFAVTKLRVLVQIAAPFNAFALNFVDCLQEVLVCFTALRKSREGSCGNAADQRMFFHAKEFISLNVILSMQC